MRCLSWVFFCFVMCYVFLFFDLFVCVYLQSCILFLMKWFFGMGGHYFFIDKIGCSLAEKYFKSKLLYI